MSKKKSELSSADYTGVRKPIRLRARCGFCMGVPLDHEDHARCKREVAWYESLWICGCPCADDHWEKVAKHDDNDKAERPASKDRSESPETGDEAGS